MSLINTTKKLGIYSALRDAYHKRIAYYSLKPKWNLIERIVSIKFKKIKLKFKLTDEQTSCYSRPIWKCEPLCFLKNELKGYLQNCSKKNKSGIVIDVGSYQGALPVYLRKIEKNKKRIICFEPIKENSQVLKENLKLNNIENVTIIKKGLWNKKDLLLFDAQGEASAISNKGKIKLCVTDLDSELKRLKINPKEVSLVKMDIEGAEIETIDGMKNLLKVGNPFLAIASYHWRNGEQTYKGVEKKLKKFGYNVKTGYPKHLTTWAWKEKAKYKKI